VAAPGRQKASEIGRVKTAVRDRDGQKCAQCGMTAEQHKAKYGRTLEVHRVVPGSLYTLEGSITLCKLCHGPQPRRKKGQPDLANGPVLLLRLSKDLVAALHRFIQAQEVPVTRQAVVLAALRRFLTERGCYPPKRS